MTDLSCDWWFFKIKSSIHQFINGKMCGIRHSSRTHDCCFTCCPGWSTFKELCPFPMIAISYCRLCTWHMILYVKVTFSCSPGHFTVTGWTVTSVIPMNSLQWACWCQASWNRLCGLFSWGYVLMRTFKPKCPCFIVSWLDVDYSERCSRFDHLT